jgi:hypothetical protein
LTRERFVRSIKEECLGRMILIGEGSLRRAVAQFCEHYHRERNHQGLGNKIIDPDFGSGGESEVQCRARLGRTAALLLPGCGLKQGRFEFPDTRGTNIRPAELGRLLQAAGEDGVRAMAADQAGGSGRSRA